MYSAKDIPISAENAISRADLARKWNCSDRVARQRIAKLRCDESETQYVIVSHSRNGVHGYYRSNAKADIEHFKNEMEKRARNTFLPIRQARRVLKRIEMQEKYGKGIA